MFQFWSYEVGILRNSLSFQNTSYCNGSPSKSLIRGVAFFRKEKKLRKIFRDLDFDSIYAYFAQKIFKYKK